MRIINGRLLADKIQAELRAKISQSNAKPGLAIILVGHDPASHIYVGLKQRAAAVAGVGFKKFFYPAEASQEEIIAKIKELNRREEINGIVVQLPLPKGFDENRVVAAIDPAKDVDGFHPENIKSLLSGRPGLVPGLAEGILRLINSAGGIKGKKGVVVANSEIFAGPVSYLLKKSGAAVEICLTPDKQDCQSVVKNADIVIIAIGRPGFLKAGMVKNGATVIDVGYNRVNGKVIGDADFKTFEDKDARITPVPGGVGPVTVAMLLANVFKAYVQQKK